MILIVSVVSLLESHVENVRAKRGITNMVCDYRISYCKA